MFALTLATYSGMQIPIEDGDRADLRRIAADLLRRRRRQGHPISVIHRGQEWEIEERENARLVDDRSGLLFIADVGAECTECGQTVDDTDRRKMSSSARHYFVCQDCHADRNGDRYETEDSSW